MTASTSMTETERVYDALVDIFRMGKKPVTPDAIAERASLSRAKVHNALKTLHDVQQRVTRHERGRYRPAEVFREEEAISWTRLADGSLKLEKGDRVMEFTPREYSWLLPGSKLPAEQAEPDMVMTLLKQTKDQVRRLKLELAELRNISEAQGQLEFSPSIGAQA